jgi:hypothetical protein
MTETCLAIILVHGPMLTITPKVCATNARPKIK